MTSTTTDRRLGVNSGMAVKVACRLATTANITLSGLQTIDGSTTADYDRVLVKDQDDASENGIYNASLLSWTRAKDFDGNNDVIQGSLVGVVSGTVNTHTFWWVTTENPIVFGTSDLAFSRTLVNDISTLSFLQSGTGAVVVPLQDSLRERISVTQFGVTSAKIQQAIDRAAALGADLYFPPAVYAASVGLTLDAPVGLFFARGASFLTTADITPLSLTNGASETEIRGYKVVAGVGSTKPGLLITNAHDVKIYSPRITLFNVGARFSPGSGSSYCCSIHDGLIVSNTTINIDAQAQTNELNLFNVQIGGGSQIGCKVVDSTSFYASGGGCEGNTVCVFDFDATSTLDAGHLVEEFHLESNTCSAGDFRIGNTAAVNGVKAVSCFYDPDSGNDSAFNLIRGSGCEADGGTLHAGYTGVPFERIGAAYDSDSFVIKGLKVSGGGVADRHFRNFRTPNQATLTYLAPTSYDANYADAARFNQYRINSGSMTAGKNYYAGMDAANLVSAGGAPGALSRLYARSFFASNGYGGDFVRGVYAQGIDVDSLPASFGQSTSAVAVGASGTITTSGVSSVCRVAPTAARAAIVLQAGTRDGQVCMVVNESTSANTLTFDTAATSHVADGATTVIAGLRSAVFVWDSNTSFWYRS